ncbi:uncharacterized protein LOC129599618 [Paramacrobiotus metropolitanus]|uniref:uncharacterized protein LOC129599618 n=1 Tax=Paramacrobiotus metropolitanus TaxID=2943436 RepID=UPI0024458438|nr:uncharacterized protein LOC129599618 [Paramacrobiotus metropolitanus]
MGARAVKRWCAIDVFDDEEHGRIRRGIVRDLLPYQGFIVDFHYPGHDAEFIPFTAHIIFSHTIFAAFLGQVQRTGSYHTGLPVESLMRLSPTDPWCWYPSTLLAGGSLATYAVVDIECEGKSIRRVLEVGRVRRRSQKPSPPRVTNKGCVAEIQKYRVRLPIKSPRDVGVAGVEEFVELWEEMTDTRVVTLDTEKWTLEYLSESWDELRTSQITDTLRRMKAKCAAAENRSSPHGYQQSPEDQQMISRPPSSLSLISEDDDIDPPITMLDMMSMSEIFSHLNVDEQMTCRRVCHAWNDLLTSPHLYVHIDLGDPRLHSRARLPSLSHGHLPDGVGFYEVPGDHRRAGGAAARVGSRPNRFPVDHH